MLTKRKSVLVAATLLIGVLAYLNGRTVEADSNYFVLTTGTPFAQNWSNTGLITTNLDWSGVPSIIGYAGGGMASNGQDPQTVLADGSATLVTVVANQNDPNTPLVGGVGEFDGIANPVVALQAGAVSNAPHLDLRFNTTGCIDPLNRITISYNLRDIDGSNGNTVQMFSLQFRVGAAGAYTNVPAGFVADATTGPTLATLVTPVGAELPAAAKGVAQLHIRIITANAPGNDEWVGVDDIQVRCAVPSAASATLAGRVMRANGSGIAKASVTVSGGSLTAPRTTLTSAFGYYSFDDLQAGQTYIVTVGSKSFTFAVPSRAVQLVDSVADADFVAEP